MWQPGEGVLYLWVELIRNGDFLESLGMNSGSTLRSVHRDAPFRLAYPHAANRISHPAPHVLSPLLTSHDSNAKSTQFANCMFYCSVCLGEQKGSRCLQLTCSHVFCRACLEDFWDLCITEGDVDRVGCPDPDCVKARTEAQEEEVRRVLPEEKITRLRWLREKRALERDPSIMYCPMAFCQTAVPKPSIPDEESGWARLRTCPRCNCSFCAFCKRTW
jgi:E3 ubiquitin-protein ligase RNF14